MSGDRTPKTYEINELRAELDRLRNVIADVESTISEMESQNIQSVTIRGLKSFNNGLEAILVWYGNLMIEIKKAKHAPDTVLKPAEQKGKSILSAGPAEQDKDAELPEHHRIRNQPGGPSGQEGSANQGSGKPKKRKVR